MAYLYLFLWYRNCGFAPGHSGGAAPDSHRLPWRCRQVEDKRGCL